MIGLRLFKASTIVGFICSVHSKGALKVDENRPMAGSFKDSLKGRQLRDHSFYSLSSLFLSLNNFFKLAAHQSQKGL